METTVYEQFAELERTHFWFRGRRRIFFDLLGRALAGRPDAGRMSVLEIGCGAGGMLVPLSRFGTVVGLDIAHDYLAYCRDRGFSRVVHGSGYELPFADRSFDLVALFDTIEHIPDDRRVLAEARRVLRPGGLVFVSVPAYQFLYSQNDRVAHHLRRYTRRQLRDVLAAAGLVPRKLTYFNTFLFPLILPALGVLILKERVLGLPQNQTNLSHQFSKPVNELFAAAMGSERLWLRHVDFPFGHSLIAMAG
jgi:SAM-dependent methyltransferase